MAWSCGSRPYVWPVVATLPGDTFTGRQVIQALELSSLTGHVVDVEDGARSVCGSLFLNEATTATVKRVEWCKPFYLPFIVSMVLGFSVCTCIW